MSWLFRDELRYFVLAVVAIRHDLLDFLERLNILIHVFFLVSLILIILQSDLLSVPFRPAVLSIFQLRNNNFLFLLLAPFQKHLIIKFYSIYIYDSNHIITIFIIMNQIPDLEAESYIETQFLFYLIPSYYGVLAFMWRQSRVIDSQPTYYVYNILGQSTFQFIFNRFINSEQNHRNQDQLTYKTPPASYVMKSKLCMLNALLYLLMIVLSFVSTSTIFYSANHKLLSFLYLFGFVAWYSAAFVLRNQYQRNMAQSIWIHRLFWILAGTFSIYKMFQDYFLPLNLFFNILFIISNFVLAVYGIYRPEDTDILQLTVNNQDIPGFVKIFFETIELNQWIRKIFAIQDQVLDIQNNNDFQMGRQKLGDQQLLQIGTVFKYNAQTIKNQINLLKQLPRRNVFVDQKIRYIKVNDRMKGCFLIISQIDYSRSQAERSFQQFMQLYLHLKQIFSPQNFPKHQLPKFTAVSPSGQLTNEFLDASKRSQQIQKWLDEIFKTPIFMTKQVLQFLNVSKQLSAPFITYFDHSYKMFCSKQFLLLSQNKLKNQLKSQSQIKKTQNQYFNQAKTLEEQTDNQKLMTLIKKKLEFKVNSDAQNILEQNFRFLLTCLVDKKSKYSWSIDTTQQKILLLNQMIQDDCNCSVPAFYSIIASRQKGYKNKTETYRNYIERLLADQKYYCTSLFRFIRFDPIGLQVSKQDQKGQWLKQEKENTLQQTFYFQDKGNMIEVTRIQIILDKNQQYTIEFDLKKSNKFYRKKKTQDLQNLRNGLLRIYRGVSSIPQIMYKHADKSQIKKSIQIFLLKIQNLSKIQINKDYQQFYKYESRSSKSIKQNYNQ